ncbi:MAG: phosphate permease [Nitrospinae bacterium]|nr:phosphate permease [Nitrospinota bacterium]
MTTALILVVIACIFALYMAWNIGANDVANSMASSIGSGVVSLKNAIWIAAIAEFAGAVLVGSSVTSTIRKGIVDPAIFADNPEQFMLGMTAALLGAALWLHAATVMGMPVSTTHSIVGAVIGFGLVAKGAGGLNYGTLFTIVMSWVISPVSGGLLGFLIFYFVREKILTAEDQNKACRFYAPYILFVFAVVFIQSFVFKGIKNLKLPLTFWTVLLVGLVVGAVVLIGSRWWISSNEHVDDNFSDRFFKFLLISTCGYVAFAHGANDVANAVGPLAAVIGVFQNGVVTAKVTVPWWVLVLGGSGIVAGLAIAGWKVIATIGSQITEITPQNGFAAQFGAATTVLVCSQLGLPISTTHTIVGAVIGVGMARGVRALNLRVIRNIISSWVLTIPFAAGATMLVYRILEGIIS